MGLLDDAIRDHLELKRRHGADPSEVARQEQEAFGPGRDESPDGPAGHAEPFEAEDEYEPRPGDGLQETTDEEEPAPPPAESPPPAEDPAAEDVLEETPEFLQETPEHDRLWFEQKPPKDFDFGG